ncbi:hypothetical protein EJB05_35334, partial [Eragrostis curvula]
MSTVPLPMIVDDDQWDAKDLAGRLGIVAHAAFLRAGFVPYGDEPTSGYLLKQVDDTGSSQPSLSRRYTAAQLARRREGAPAPAEVAVQELLAQGNGDFVFHVFLLTRDGHQRFLCEAVLDAAALAPLLSGRLDDPARALETGSAGARLWDALAEWVFPVLLYELRSRNVTGFASLPDDAKVEILKRLADWKDLASVECTSRQLRRLVTERDGELWKTKYESMNLPTKAEGSADHSEGLGSWKERYVNALRRCYEEWLAQRRREREAELERLRDLPFQFF